MIEEAAAEWQTNGWVVVEGLVPAEDVGAALAEIRPRNEIEHTPTGSTRRSDLPGDPARFRTKQFDGTTLFPYPNAPNLNRLFVHPAIVAFAKAALETDDLRIYQSRVWSKYGDHTNYEQPHHLDGNHSLVPIRQGPGWGHLECFLYLHDVSADRVRRGQCLGHSQVFMHGWTASVGREPATECRAATTRHTCMTPRSVL